MFGMKKWIFLTGLCVLTGNAFAEDSEVAALKAQIDALSRKLAAVESRMMMMEKPAPNTQAVYIPPAPEKGGSVKTPFDINMSGYIDTQYQGTFENSKGQNVGRTFTDKAKDTFSLNAAKLKFEKVADPEGGAGFRIHIMMGSDSRYFFNNFQTNNDGTPTGGVSSTAFTFEEAYAQYVLPLRPFENSRILPLPGDFKAGRFVTLTGNEVIDSPNNWNITRSVGFGYGIPFTHTGVRATYQILNDFLTVTNGINNGWDNDVDNNRFKTFENAVSFSPVKNVTWTTASYIGPESTGVEATANRFVVTNVLGWQATKKLAFAGEFDMGNQRRVDIAGDQVFQSAQWYGYAAYAKYQFTDKLAAAYRFEIFDDSDRYRNWTGVGTAGATTDLGNTLTLEYKLRDNLIARGEYRIDYAHAGDGKVFNGNRQQNTLGGQLIYLFG